MRTSETSCPFCASAISLADAAPRAMPTQRLGRAATFAFGAAIATSVVGCGTSTTPGNDAGNQSDAFVAPADAGTDSGLVAAYGGPPVDAGPPNDADLPDSFSNALYGAPPPPPEPNP